MKKSTRNLFACLFISFLLTSSCGKDDEFDALDEPSSIIELPDAPEGTQWDTSTINENEIGGSDLSVMSAYYEDSPINEGKVETIVSQEGIQVLFVTDGNDKLRGLTHTIKNGNDYEIVPVDVSSTVNSLFLLSPSLITISPTETVELINKLKSLSSYNKVLSEAKNSLPNSTLDDLLIDPKFVNLIQETLNEIDSINVASKSISKKLLVDLYGNRLDINNSDEGVKIRNQAFRYIKVYRSYIDNNEVLDTKLLYESMGGGTKASLGSLVTGTMFNSTIKVDEDYLPPTQTTTTEYWVIGSGLENGDEIPPSYIETSYTKAGVFTVGFYVSFPVLKLLFGLGNVDEQILKDVWNIIQVVNSVNNTATSLFGKDGIKSKRELTNFANLMVKTILSNKAAFSKFGVSEVGASIAKKMLPIINIPNIIANLGAFGADFKRQKRYTKFTINTQIYPPTLLSPINEAENQPTSITLSWEVNPIAWNYYIELSTDIDFSNPILKTTDSQTTSQNFDGLEPLTPYYWRVQAVKGNGAPSKYSEVWSFTTGEQGTNGDSDGDGVIDSEDNCPETQIGVTVDSNGCPITVSNDITFNPNLSYGSMTDIDGNNYKTIQIGTQTWMAENLRVTHYPNGDAIPHITDNTDWGNLADNNTDDAYSFNNNDNTTDYGALYTYAAAIADNWTRDNTSGQGICPNGWSLPTDAEWTILTDYLGGISVAAGGKMKETGTTHWNSPNTGATNSSGFTALPSGFRVSNIGAFLDVGDVGDWWSGTENSSSRAYGHGLGYNNAGALHLASTKSSGYCVRCVRD